MRRQISVIQSILATIVINKPVNILPINGLNTEQISNRFQVNFVLAGYVFSFYLGADLSGIDRLRHLPGAALPVGVTLPTWITSGPVALTLVTAFFLCKPGMKLRPAA